MTWRRNKQVTIYYWNKGRQVPLPRSQTKHLDGKPKDVVLKWVEDWEKQQGLTKAKINRMVLFETDLLSVLWKQYTQHQAKRRSRRLSTEKGELWILESHIVPFFVGKHEKKDPSDWHALIPPFHDWLYEQSYADKTIQKTLWTLERFGTYLVFKQHMSFPFVVQTPSSTNNKITPLKVKKSPEEIINFATQFTNNGIDFKLATLLGYFAALSPSELFALHKEDLITGVTAETLCKTLQGFRKHGLGSRLGITISKALRVTGEAPMVKNDYRKGVVNIWDSRAALLIANLVKDKPEGRLFPFSLSWLERAWREQVKLRLGCTPHDLRRASCLYLGREKRIDLTLLQEHMRHAEIETTMLYTREPAVVEAIGKHVQDFDDVA